MIRNIPLFAASIAFIVFLTIFAADKANAQPGPSTYRLIGTVTAGGFIGAVLDDAKGEQTLYRLNEQLPDGSKLVKVRSDHILLKRSDGATYEMYINHDMKIAAQQTAPHVASPPPPVVAPPGEPTSKAFSRKQRRIRRSPEGAEE